MTWPSHLPQPEQTTVWRIAPDRPRLLTLRGACHALAAQRFYEKHRDTDGAGWDETETGLGYRIPLSVLEPHERKVIKRYARLLYRATRQALNSTEAPVR